MDSGGRVESFRNLNALKRPVETVTVFESSADPDKLSVFADHTHSLRNWYKGWPVVLDDIQPDRHRTGSGSPDHSNGSANYLYAWWTCPAVVGSFPEGTGGSQ